MKNSDWVTVDFTNMTEGAIGERGVFREEILKALPMAKAAFEAVQKNRGKDELFLGWTRLPYEQDEIAEDILKTAKEIRENFDAFVLLGIGGSALGPQMTATALLHLHYNELPRQKRGGPRFYVEDNIDPVRMRDLLDVIDLKSTCFNVVSKSGATSETMAQLLIVLDLLKKEGLEFKKHLIFTTDAKKGNLVKLAEELGGVKRFVLPDGVGGRFSQLSPVGLLPAAVTGCDIKALLKGASVMDERCQSDNPFENPALMCALLQVIAMKKGRNIGVMMPYSDHLKYLSDWYAQLWAESLGKNRTKDGKPCNVGQTPVKSLGATDQHSQVQLYTEGPYDKVVTFLSVDHYDCKTPIPETYARGDLSFLGGHTMEELIRAENSATAYALKKAGRMNFTVCLPRIDELSLGQTLFLFELQTAYAGEMLHINAYDQPGVEAGKRATFALLGKEGYEELRKELSGENSDPEFVI